MKKHKLQKEIMYIRVSAEFKRGVEQAAINAGEPSVSEFVKCTIIKEARKHGVKIRR